MFRLKDNPYMQAYQPSTSHRRQENFPKPAVQAKYPFEMDNMKKLLQNISNDMVDLKRTSTKNQANNTGFARPPFRIPYQPPQNKTPSNTDETLTSDEI